MQPFVFTRRGRSAATALALAGAYAALIVLIVWLDAALWVVALLALPTLPAVRDLIVNPSAGLRLTDTGVDWHSGHRRGKMRLAELDRVRFDRRWDMSVRVTLVPKGGAGVRLPAESLPPWRILEAQFEARGVRTERHAFTAF